MNAREANSVLAILRHLDGSEVTLAEELLDDVQLLADAAGVALGGVLPVDLDTIADTLTEVARWHEDAAECYWDDEEPQRAVETAKTGGLL